MATASPTHGLHGTGFLVKKTSGWLIAIGVLFIILGMFAIAEPFAAGLAVGFLVGWLLIMGGVAHLVAAFAGGGVWRVIVQLLIGIAYVAGGVYFLTHPLLTLGTLTLLLAGIILVEAVFEIVLYFRHRETHASGWLLINALITLFVGGLVWFHWPSSSVWAIGTLVGVNLLMTGISRVMLGMAARTLSAHATVA
ncbi:MAG: DUF308 domain-containing protein [Candidatus Acidiferrum sp.]|jgi:uncharacterized membrane protein HdeD (DUF308 family)